MCHHTWPHLNRAWNLIIIFSILKVVALVTVHAETTSFVFLKDIFLCKIVLFDISRWIFLRSFTTGFSFWVSKSRGSTSALPSFGVDLHRVHQVSLSEFRNPVDLRPLNQVLLSELLDFVRFLFLASEIPWIYLGFIWSFFLNFK
ncbi:hypothetical protein LXL04_007598 [Taraxacum kok-saghyz]